MSIKNLLPSTEAKNHISKETAEILPAKYRQGNPRQYRFNASNGNFNIKGETPVTKSGKEFKIIPIAIRVFRDNLFEQGRKNWAELFFLNQANQVCSLLFHGFSVENLTELESDMFYEDLKIGEVILTVKPAKKDSKSAEGATYYIAEFEFDAADKEVLKAQSEAVKDLIIYRSDTWNEDATYIVGHNYPQQKVIDLIGAPKPETQENSAIPATQN